MKKIIAALLVLVCVVSLAACTGGEAKYDIGGKDRAKNFLDIYDEAVASCDEAKLVDDATLGKVLGGTAIVRLIDFSGDGVYELYIAYSDGTVPYANHHKIVGFDNGPAVLFSKEITTKSTASAAGPCVWLYTDANNRGYIVLGDDLSSKADYYTYVGLSGAEKVYDMQVEFTKTGGQELAGTYEKIELVNPSNYDAVVAENKTVLNSIQGQD